MTVDELREEAQKNGEKEIDDCCQVRFIPPIPSLADRMDRSAGFMPGTRYEPKSVPSIVVDDQGRAHYRTPLLHDRHLGGVEEY